MVYPDGGMGSVQGSPTSLCTRDSGITVEPAGVREEQLARVLKVAYLYCCMPSLLLSPYYYSTPRVVKEKSVELVVIALCLCCVITDYNESTTGADASVEALKLYHAHEAKS